MPRKTGSKVSKTDQINLRCTNVQSVTITALAEKAGLTKSQYILNKVLEPDNLPHKTTQYLNLFTAINRIGSNINQSVKAINRADGRFSEAEIEDHVKLIKSQLTQIYTRLSSL